MDASRQGDAPSAASSQPADAVAWLRSLQARLVDFKGPDDLTEIVSALSVALDEVLAEHAGMAEELLSAYEQLGITFEVTRRLPEVQGESEVVDLFVENLRQSFEAWDVFIARAPAEVQSSKFEVRSGRRADSGAGRSAAPEGGLSQWVQGVVHTALQRKGVVVEVAPARSASGPAGGVQAAATPYVLEKSIAEVMVAPVLAGRTPVCAIVIVRGSESPPFRAVDMMLTESLATFCGDLIRNHRLVHELREMSVAMVRSLVNAVDQKDEYTCGHSLRVGYYATELGKRVALREVELQMLQWAALLHDVGKIGIRDAVLKKAGKLTDEEFDHIKEHPVRSYRVVQEVRQLADALDGILHHHERWNGTGYPSGLKGDEIPLQARIIQMADMFDALTSNRSYRPAFEWQRALEILEEEAGTTVDPELQKVFDGMIRSRLAGGTGAWERMIEEAERFAQGCADVGGPESDGPERGRFGRLGNGAS